MEPCPFHGEVSQQRLGFLGGEAHLLAIYPLSLERAEHIESKLSIHGF